MIQVFAMLVALVLITSILWDAFETMILPRRVNHKFRMATLLTRDVWQPLVLLMRYVRHERRRESILSIYGPLSTVVLLTAWVLGLIFSFALIQWSMGSHISTPEKTTSFGADLYMSGTTFFTLGLGDVIPLAPWARFVAVIEAGMGFGLLALVIGYFPTLYQAFSRREVNIALLDARAGSPPVAATLLLRHCSDDRKALGDFLRDWERWSAELLESHVSYPSLAFFRSQHDHQSWVASITMILDVTSLILTGIDNFSTQQAQLTFAMARHAAVDLAQTFQANPKRFTHIKRLDEEGERELLCLLRQRNIDIATDPDAQRRFADLRAQYEPFVQALSDRFLMPLPSWFPSQNAVDDWQTSELLHVG
jgi:Ion channel